MQPLKRIRDDTYDKNLPECCMLSKLSITVHSIVPLLIADLPLPVILYH